MNKTALSAAVASALVISTATAGELPSMDVMNPWDTPASTADRIGPPPDPHDVGFRHADAGIENAAARAPEALGPPPLLDLPGLDGNPGQGSGPGDNLDLGLVLNPEKPDKPEKPEKPEDPEDDDDDG
jgi:hypothetical protein